jgi:hypothetical protein
MRQVTSTPPKKQLKLFSYATLFVVGKPSFKHMTTIVIINVITRPVVKLLPKGKNVICRAIRRRLFNSVMPGYNIVSETARQWV